MASIKLKEQELTHENLSMMDAVTTKYGKTTVITLSKTLAIILALIFVVCLVVTGLLVYSFTSNCQSVEFQALKSDLNNTQKSLCDDIFGNNDVVTTISSANVGEDSVVVTSTSVPSFTSTAATTDSTAKTTKTDEDDVRLPKTIVPHSYQIHLIPFLQQNNFTFHGSVKIIINVTKTTNNITLHSDTILVDTVSVTDLKNNTVSTRDVRMIKSKQFLVIELDEQLSENAQYVVFIVFRGVLNDLLEGFYRSSYEENGETRWIAATQFQATDARKSFPCFDEPALKATFQINIARPKNMSSISNMPKTHSTPFTGGLPDYIWDHYQETKPMSTYLVAFVVSDFQNISNGNFSIWARPSALSQAQYSLKIAPVILKYYERLFGIKYPLPKLDMVAIPDFSAGAMENWGLITYQEPVLLYEKSVSSKSSLQRIAHVVAHELAHQWFGNLVTPVWWEDLWLNEGFATYVEFLGAHAVGPKWKDPDLFLVVELHGSLNLDALKSSHPISVPVNNPEEVDDIFDRISYSKGASIIRMMEQFLTPSVFHKSISIYLKNREYGNADQDFLWKTLTEQSHRDGVLSTNLTIKEIMETWTLQTGFPVVTATRKFEKTSFIKITQERFLLDRDRYADDSLWWVPITYTNSLGVVKKVWMDKMPEISLDDPLINEKTWYLINVNQTGYYRVNYDENNWKLLIQQMQKDRHYMIDPKNRAQLIDDALNLALAGYVSYEIGLNTTLYLVNEKEYVPWRAALNNFDYLYKMFVRTAHFDKYKGYVIWLINGLYEELGFRELSNEDPTTILTRTEIVDEACKLGLRDCVIIAVKQFQNWMNSANPDNENLISPDLKKTVYCTAIGEGGQEEWDFAWDRYLNTNVANEKEILLSALACSKEIWILSRFLERAVTDNSGIRKHDTARVFAAVTNNPVGQDLVYSFLKSNWQRIRDYLGPSSMYLSSIIKTVSGNFNTEEDISDIKSFFKRKGSDLGVTLRSALQSIEQAEANVKWMKKYYKIVVNWLQVTNRRHLLSIL